MAVVTLAARKKNGVCVLRHIQWTQFTGSMSRPSGQQFQRSNNVNASSLVSARLLSRNVLFDASNSIPILSQYTACLNFPSPGGGGSHPSLPFLILQLPLDVTRRALQVPRAEDLLPAGNNAYRLLFLLRTLLPSRYSIPHT